MSTDKNIIGYGVSGHESEPSWSVIVGHGRPFPYSMISIYTDLVDVLYTTILMLAWEYASDYIHGSTHFWTACVCACSGCYEYSYVHGE